jgi:hypothetical protein
VETDDRGERKKSSFDRDKKTPSKRIISRTSSVRLRPHLLGKRTQGTVMEGGEGGSLEPKLEVTGLGDGRTKIE